MAQRRVVLRERFQLRSHRRRAAAGRAFGFGQRLERRLRAGEQARAMLQALVLGGDLLPLAFARRELLQVLDALARCRRARPRAARTARSPRRDLLEALPGPIGSRLSRPRLRSRRAHPGARAARRCAAATGARAGRAGRPATRRPPCSCASVAAWPLTKQRERPLRSIVRRRTSWPGSPARSRSSSQARSQRLGNVELGRQLGPLGALAHDCGIGAAADQELDGVDQDRLAGAGFAGEAR